MTSRKPQEVYVVLDLGTPANPVVGVFASYSAACDRQLRLGVANDRQSDFIVDTHYVNQEV